jgi:hypothetical protein
LLNLHKINIIDIYDNKLITKGGDKIVWSEMSYNKFNNNRNAEYEQENYDYENYEEEDYVVEENIIEESYGLYEDLTYSDCYGVDNLF